VLVVDEPFRSEAQPEPSPVSRSAWVHLAGRGAAVLLGLALVAACTPGAGLRLPADEGRLAVSDDVVPDDEALGVEGGLLSDPATAYDTDLPALSNLDPALLAAVQQAVDAAAADGVTMVVTSGWRSTALQQQLLDAATSRYGSREEALKYVSSPEVSHHVPGTAVDIGPTDADSWLSQHGADFGLCQTYANEMWHFELATEPGGECPAMLPDATHG
jgi:hypothetical protein